MRVVVTAEHATNNVPAELGDLGLSRSARESHIAWDAGSAEVARAVSATFKTPWLAGEVSRLVVDLNRSATNPRVVPTRSFGVAIPGKHGLSKAQIRDRIETHWRPFRALARERIAEVLRHGDRCLHLSIHTFVPQLGRDMRDYDFGVLYDPSRPLERELAAELVRHWRSSGWSARRNAPYRGVADGHATGLRRELADVRYAGLEIEVDLLPESRSTYDESRDGQRRGAEA